MNPFGGRFDSFAAKMRAKKIDMALLCDACDIYALSGAKCDAGVLAVLPSVRAKSVLYTDFRYIPEVNRLCPWLATGDISRLSGKKPFAARGAGKKRIGFDPGISHARFLSFEKAFPGAEMVDVSADIASARAVKTAGEIEKIKAAAALNDKIWGRVERRFRAGMTERDMARLLRREMVEFGDGEAFPTIVCIGANAAECHHVPDDTVWDGKEPVLVDMGVTLGGYCSDMTRCIKPARASAAYRKVYNAVLEANRLAAAAAKPGVTGRELDAVARRYLSKAGFGRAFGHSLGHGVGLEVHEPPYASRKSDWILEPGMTVTIEPGVYLEGNLGVRIEDLAVITDDGCEILSHSEK